MNSCIRCGNRHWRDECPVCNSHIPGDERRRDESDGLESPWRDERDN